jgi:MFS family permease
MKYSSRVAEAGKVRGQVIALCGVQFVDVLGVTSAITAIPAMLAGVSAPAQATPILATIYAMFFGGLLIVGARLGDRFGHRKVLLVGTMAFTIVGAIGASAQEIVQLVAARGLQGAAAAISVPSALWLLLDVAEEQPARRGALAAWSASGAAAGALGYLVGGVLVDVLNWRAVFWVNVPVGLLLAVAIWLLVQPAKPVDSGAKLDLVGAFLLVAAVMVVIVGASLIEDTSRRTAGLLLAVDGLLLGTAFVAFQRRARNPLVPRSAFASANLRTGTIVSFINTATTSSAGVLATLFLQEQLGASPVAAGLVLMPFSLAVIAGSALSKPLGAKLTPRHLAAAGLAAITAGNLLLAVTYGSIAGIVGGVVVAGAGLGVASVAATATGTDVVETLSGTASGVLNTGAQLGTAIGVAALLVLAASVDRPWPGTALAWGVAAAIAGISALSLSVADRFGTRRRTDFDDHPLQRRGPSRTSDCHARA